MKRLFASAAGLLLAVTLAACGSPRGYSSYDDYDSSSTYHATCQDRAGRILADWRCNQHSAGSVWAHEPYGTYQSHLRANPSYYAAGRTCTCGSMVQPKGTSGKAVGIQRGASKTVTVFKAGKQVGSMTKFNQDAKKASTVTSESRRDTVKKSSWGSYTGKSSNRSSYGSSSRSSSSSRSRR